MDKIFKRNPKSATESEKDKSATPINPSASTEDTQPKPPVDGHAPKFAWKIKPQGDDKTAKSASAPVKDIPDDLYSKCPGCKELIYKKELDNNKRVCHKCGYHFRMGAWERINLLTDEGSFEEINARLITTDPLHFTSLAEPPYAEKAAQVSRKTGLNDSLVTGLARIEELPVALGVIDFAYFGGSMGSVLGEKLVRLIEEAMARRIPVLTVSASGGARMHEGVFSLMQMAKTTAALARLSELGLPYFSLLTDPCTGGVIASYASMGDVMLAEPGALIGFAGPRVIEQTTREKLPPDFQKAEFLLEHGMIDQVVPRKELRPMLANLLRFYAAAQPQPQLQIEEREVSYAR